MTRPAGKDDLLETTSRARKREIWATIAAMPLMIVAGFVHFLLYHRYDLLTPEAILAIAVLIAVGLLLGLLAALDRSDQVRVVMLIALLMWFCDIQFDLLRLIAVRPFDDSLVLNFLVMISIMFAGVLVIMALRRHLASILATVFSVFLLVTILVPPQPIPYGQQTIASKPVEVSEQAPVLHIVMDGHIGVEGIPLDIEGGAALRQDLTDFYLNHGFRLFGRVYSQHFLTNFSLASLLNPGPQNFPLWVDGLGDNRWILRTNGFFQRLSEQGLVIRVYQTDYLDYCQTEGVNIEACYRYSASSPKLIEGLELSLPDKLELLFTSYLGSSAIYTAGLRLYDQLGTMTQTAGWDLLPPTKRHTTTFFSLGTLDVVEVMIADMAAAPRGRAYFLHLLLPHAPYVFDQNCELLGDISEWLDRRRDHHLSNTTSSPDYRAAAYQRYFAQTRCLLKTLDRVFTTLKTAGVWDQATIVLHGDHGSRITLRDPALMHLEVLTPRDLIDSFSTFYAIRSPDLTGGYDRRRVTLQQLFGEHLLDLAPVEDPEIVYTLPGIGENIRPLQMVPVGPD